MTTVNDIIESLRERPQDWRQDHKYDQILLWNRRNNKQIATIYFMDYIRLRLALRIWKKTTQEKK